ncbi:MAG: UvrD-helicase domain-containing protein [Gemmatimonadales bacterium]
MTTHLTDGTIVPTARQREAIEAGPGPVLVLAGPGAGKTFCLIARIQYLVDRLGYDPAKICAVTFTNKAAGEIASRLRGTLGDQASVVTRSTIHALCVQLLRRHGSAIGVPETFGIADEEYQLQVLRRAGFRKDQSWPLRQFSRHRIQGIPLEDRFGQIYERYREILKSRGLLDFDDLVLLTDQLFRNHPAITDQIAAQWEYLLVDEFQDLNRPQYAILKRLADRHRNFFAVGDDEQAIYAWAGADLQVISDFVNDFSMTKKEIVLDENKRCSRQIFEQARRLVEINPPLFAKDLRAPREGEFPVVVERFDDEFAEARWIIEDIRADRRRERRPLGDYALLYRRHEIGDTLEAALLHAGIPCQLAQGRALGDDPVVQYVLAALKVIASPGDPILEAQFARVVLPPTLYLALRADADRENIELLERLRRVSRTAPKADEDAKKVRRCLYALANLPAMADRHLTLASLVEELLSQRVGEYQTRLEENADEISDPNSDSAVIDLGLALLNSRHGRRTVWLPRLGGVEIGLAGMLRNSGITTVEYLDEGAAPRADDLVLGRSGPVRPLAVFKALQLAQTRHQRSSFRDFVAVDIESNELDLETAEAIELAAVKVRDGQIVDQFQTFIAPLRPVSAGAREVHGITDADLVGAPSFAEAWERFRAFAGADVLVAHNGHGFDFPILERLAAGHPAGNRFAVYDTLPLARALHPGSRKLVDLARTFGIDAGQSHRALDDTRTLAQVFLRLEQEKLARARKTACVNLLDHLAIGLALSEPSALSQEEKMFLDIGKIFALGRYSQCLGFYDAERSLPGAAGVPDIETLIEKLGGRKLLAALRREKSAEDRYPAAMARLKRIIDGIGPGVLREQLAQFLERVALSSSRGGPEVERQRVNLLTLHSTKGLEFSRVYVVGVEDAQLPGSGGGKEPSKAELEEGRRLLYVGMTRAKDRLVLTRANERKGLPCGGERYLKEMGLGEPDRA